MSAEQRTARKKPPAARKRAVQEAQVPTTAVETPPSGHNQPPERISQPGLDLTPEQWAEWMAHIFEGLEVRAQELIDSFGRFDVAFPIAPPLKSGDPPIGIEKWTDDIQGRAGDLRGKLAAVVKQAEHLHGIEKAPILAAAKAVDGFKNGFLARLVERDSKGKLIVTSAKPINTIVRRQTLYARWLEEQSRASAIAESERLKQEAEAEAAAAINTMDPAQLEKTGEAYARAVEAEDFARAPAADHSRVHGPVGSVTSLHSNWQFFPDESDLLVLAKAVVAGNAPLTYLAFNTTRINIAVHSEKVREIQGCVIRNETRI